MKLFGSSYMHQTIEQKDEEKMPTIEVSNGLNEALNNKGFTFIKVLPDHSS